MKFKFIFTRRKLTRTVIEPRRKYMTFKNKTILFITLFIKNSQIQINKSYIFY